MNYKKQSFFYRNSLSIVFICLFILALGAQAIFGWKEHNEELKDLGGQQIIFSAYLRSGHFFSATFENFESEFLQMALYVMLTISLRQVGSAESKDPDKQEEVDRLPDPTRNGAPGPVKKGGWRLIIYQNSLSIAFVLLFFFAGQDTFMVVLKMPIFKKPCLANLKKAYWNFLLNLSSGLKLFKIGRVNSFPSLLL